LNVKQNEDKIMKQPVCILIFCAFVIITAVSGCDGASSTGQGNPVDGDVSVDGDNDVGEDIETMEEELDSVDKTDDAEDGDMEVPDGDAEEIAEDEVELEEEQQLASVPRFTGFTAAGGTVASDSHRLIFRMAPAAMVMKASNDTTNLNATIMLQAY